MRSRSDHLHSILQNRNDVTYDESLTFDYQFSIVNQCETTLIKARSRFSLVAILPPKSSDFDKYTQERQSLIDIFNNLLTTQLRVDPTLSLDSFQILRQLGEGGYGSVLLACYTDTHKYIALKAIKKSTLIETNEQHIIISERQYTFALHHPNIVQFITSFKDNEYVYLGFEWLQGGDLYTLMNSRKLTELQAKFYSAQIVLALDYLHGCKVIYRDLKPENIMLTQRGYVKLIDLGLAKLIRGYSRTFCGTPHYIAPEIIMHQPYSTSPDYWSLGIIIHEMITGEAPYDRTDANDTVSIENDNPSMSTVENESTDIIRPSSKHYNM